MNPPNENNNYLRYDQRTGGFFITVSATPATRPFTFYRQSRFASKDRDVPDDAGDRCRSDTALLLWVIPGVLAETRPDANPVRQLRGAEENREKRPAGRTDKRVSQFSPERSERKAAGKLRDLRALPVRGRIHGRWLELS